MSVEEKIDSIYEKLSNTPLSNIIPMILPIALECEDYEGYIILSYWSKPLRKDVQANTALRRDICRILCNEGMSVEDIKVLDKYCFEEYLKLRRLEENQVVCTSAKEMEDTLKTCEELLSITSVPSGLHPTDLYFRSQAAEKEKMIIIERRKIFEQQYAILLSYITSKLTEYRRKIVLRERKMQLEKGVKNSKNIFIIHGHNEAKRRELESLLKEKFNLIPIVLLDQPDQGLTIIEKFEKYARNCSYAFALFTPDDIVTKGDAQYFQARPNVIFELGWFYANLGRSRVCILDQASERSKIFSDLQGVLRMQFNENISEKYMEIERELKSLGII